MRVVSLLPSATEALCLIGGESMLVGRSHECDFPASIARVPVLTAQAIPATLSDALNPQPGAIDARVREQLASGQSLYRVDEKLLRELRPDVILTQDLCSVCSIDLATVRRIVADMTTSHYQPRIVSLNPQTFEDVLDDVYRVGAAVGLDQEATAAVVRLRERVFSASEYVNPFDDGPNVVFLEWTDPLFIGGHWTPQLIERAGARHPLNATVAKESAGAALGPQVAERVAGKSIRVPKEAMVGVNPDAVIIAPCGLNLEQTRGCAAALLKEDWFRSLRAVRNGRVALVDGNQYFNRPGPRLVEAYEFLVGWLNGRHEVVPAGFGWEPLYLVSTQA
ncbi:MAG: ABC transporter substrate-binding protein [Phycisphaerae bacterium]